MSSSEPRYSGRVIAPMVLERGRSQTVSLGVYLDGALVAPSGGSYSLYTPLGDAQIDAQVVSVVSDMATYAIDASELPSTLGYGEGYSERWVLTMPGGEVRTFVRSAGLAKFQLAPPLTDADILDGEYPDLVEQLGSYGSNLQGFIDGAWNTLINHLYKLGEWPDVIVTPSSLIEALKHLVCYRVFKFLFRKTTSGSRFDDLWKHHYAEYKAALGGLTYRVDADQDGVADSLGRSTVTTVVQINASPRRSLARSNKW